jgi:hypothetical protein
MHLKMVLSTVLAFILSVMFVLPVSAEVTLDDLLKRIEALEQENATLKGEVMALKDKQASQNEQILQVQSQATKAVASATGSATPSPAGNFLKTKFDTELYGFIGVAGVYSDADAAPSSSTNSSIVVFNSARPTGTAFSGGAAKRVSSFNFSAQDTRLGLNYKFPDLENGGKVGGKIEMDFSANNGPTYQPRLRLAYGQVDYDKWAVTAGQAWDIFAPLNPNMLNSAILWRAGNIGYRHAQLYLTNKWGDILGGKFTSKIGISDADDPLQENSGMPVYQAYAGFDTTILGTKTTLGVGGIYGKNSTSILGAKGPRNNNIYATVVGVTLKFTDWLNWKAEGYTGAKLEDFLAGSPTGITNTTTIANSKSVRTMGGFMELTYNPFKKVETNFGMGIDNNNADAYIPNTVDRQTIWKTNRTFYTNVKYSLTKDLLLGVEYQRFETNWLDGFSSNSDRVETAIIYKF